MAQTEVEAKDRLDWRCQVQYKTRKAGIKMLKYFDDIEGHPRLFPDSLFWISSLAWKDYYLHATRSVVSRPAGGGFLRVQDEINAKIPSRGEDLSRRGAGSQMRSFLTNPRIPEGAV